MDMKVFEHEEVWPGNDVRENKEIALKIVMGSSKL